MGRVPINVAVIDTGSGPHPDLNIVGGIDCTGEGNGFNDLNGHGTNVAGITGAHDDRRGVVGVVPGARLWSVRTIRASGTYTFLDELCGLSFVAHTRVDRNRNNDIRVANMSFGAGGRADDNNCGRGRTDEVGMEHRMICQLTRRGVTLVAAAGNAAIDFANTVPATYSEVLTVAAMADFDGKPGGRAAANNCAGVQNRDDTVVQFSVGGSNYATQAGDIRHAIAGPGACIVSTGLNGGYSIYSGTSQASPHVAGTAALCIAQNGCKGLTPAQIRQKLRGDAARYNRAHHDYGFQGDPLRPLGNRYYGFLTRAARY